MSGVFVVGLKGRLDLRLVLVLYCRKRKMFSYLILLL